MVEALKQKITQMETAHKNREADWHELAGKWRKFEEDAIAENNRSVPWAGLQWRCQVWAHAAGPALWGFEGRDR